jgi:hypothetical protein
VLLVCGFILRFGFVLWKKTYIGSPNDNIPFGEEICSIADHIVRGQGFSSPFHQDTGPTAWVAPVYPYLVALVFRLFGSYSVGSAMVLLGIQCIIAASTRHHHPRPGPPHLRCTSWILHRVVLGAQPFISSIPSQNTATPSSPNFFCSQFFSYSFSGAKFAGSRTAKRTC